MIAESQTVASSPVPRTAAPQPVPVAQPWVSETPWTDDSTVRGGDFFDLLDIVNPLQHIPIVSAIYRDLTGDQIGGAARVLGGFLYGGPIGMIGGVANAVIAESSGQDISQHLVAGLFGDESDPGEPGADEPEAGAMAEAGPDAAASLAGPAAVAAPANGTLPAAADAVPPEPAAAAPNLALGPPPGMPVLQDEGTRDRAPETRSAAQDLARLAPTAAGPSVAAGPPLAGPAASAVPIRIDDRLDAALTALAASGRPGAAGHSASVSPPALPSGPIPSEPASAIPHGLWDGRMAAARRAEAALPGPGPEAMMRGAQSYHDGARAAALLPQGRRVDRHS